ncbi:hypothetical protein ACU4GR_13540 [Methylobacterium oryzae CBMB20]
MHAFILTTFATVGTLAVLSTVLTPRRGHRLAHRRHAAGLHAGLGELPCEVRQGGLRDAILHSAGANAAHGLRRTNADKRRGGSCRTAGLMVASHIG